MLGSWKLGVLAIGAATLFGCGSSPGVFSADEGVLPDDESGVDEGDDGLDLGANAGDEGDISADPPPASGGSDATVDDPTPPTAICWYELGNPTCHDSRLGSEILRIDPTDTDTGTAAVGSAGTSYPIGDGLVNVTFAEEGTAFAFHSTIPVDGVIVKAGPGALVCEYPQSTYTDAGLVAQMDGIPEQLHAVSHVSFCDLVFSQVGTPL